MPTPTPTLRTAPLPTDPARIRAIITASTFFSPAETDIAVELIDERLAKGESSGYHFLFADDPDTAELLGYTCFGEIPCTVGSYDLYWIAVDPARQRSGLGKLLLRATEKAIAARRGRAIYIETSNRPQYAPTRNFYLACGYTEAATLKDFYNDGDDKVIYAARVPPQRGTGF